MIQLLVIICEMILFICLRQLVSLDWMNVFCMICWWNMCFLKLSSIRLWWKKGLIMGIQFCCEQFLLWLEQMICVVLGFSVVIFGSIVELLNMIGFFVLYRNIRQFGLLCNILIMCLRIGSFVLLMIGLSLLFGGGLVSFFFGNLVFSSMCLIRFMLGKLLNDGVK